MYIDLNLLRWRVVSVKTSGRKIDFEGNCFAWSTAYFFVIILNVILTHIIEIQIFVKSFLSFLLWQMKNL